VPGQERVLFFAKFLAEQLAGRCVDEVKAGAGRTPHRGMGSFIVGWRVGQPVLHVHPGPGAFEQDGSGHGRQYGRAPGYRKLRMIT
jgi:hypothetical protein